MGIVFHATHEHMPVVWDLTAIIIIVGDEFNVLNFEMFCLILFCARQRDLCRLLVRKDTKNNAGIPC